jgi:uncharacterized repeat protein (TIGR03803 family)
MSANLARAIRLLSVILVGLLTDFAWAGADFEVIYTFVGGTAPYAPNAPLTIGGNGRLYGTTAAGGSTTCGIYGCGTVFRLTLKDGHWAESVLTGFPNSSQSPDPCGPLVLDSAGNVYGTGINEFTENGLIVDGQVFQVLNEDGSYTESTIHDFAGGESDGQYANPGLVRDREGNLYGSTEAGGSGLPNGAGTVFEFSPNGDGTWTETLLYQFSYETSYNPTGPMVMDKAGNLYGTTTQGGEFGWGAVYKLSQSNGVWTYQSIYNFTPPLGQFGLSPSGLVIDEAGNIYGSTIYGGSYGVGSVYKLVPTDGSWTFTPIHSFTGSTDGAYPQGGLAVDSGGDLYGTAELGGVYQLGLVFKFAHGADGQWNEDVLHNFTGGADGSYPYGVALDSSANIYGVAEAGGLNQFGTVYEIVR